MTAQGWLPQGWVRLTAVSGPVWVNLARASDVTPAPGGGASVVVASGLILEVDETPTAIMALAGRQPNE